jgi:hypothetical protein
VPKRLSLSWYVRQRFIVAPLIVEQDWWLTPEIYLRRPPAYFPDWRIDRLLKKKAEQGVKIHIAVYKEVGTFSSLVMSLLTCANRSPKLCPMDQSTLNLCSTTSIQTYNVFVIRTTLGPKVLTATQPLSSVI